MIRVFKREEANRKEMSRAEGEWGVKEAQRRRREIGRGGGGGKKWERAGEHSLRRRLRSQSDMTADRSQWS